LKKLFLSSFIFILFVNTNISAAPGEEFSLILLPDSQNDAQFFPSIFMSQTQWIADNKTTKNIVFVTHVGDIVNTLSNVTQYKNADEAMDMLDAGNVAYSVGPGNHDMGDGSLYETYFGISRFSGKSWYGGYYGGNNYNNYSLFSASGMDFILINLQCDPTEAMLDWADALLKTNPNRRGIVESHDILKFDDSWSKQSIYTALKDNPNLFLMVCGNDWAYNDGAAYRAELGDDGHTIHIMLADYQLFSWLGNGGYLRILRFSPADDKIYATTYSPYVGKYITSYPDQMEMTYDMTIPLPVELTSFTASTNQSVINLKWQTKTEVNNYGFEVERSLTVTLSEGEGFNKWEKIGFVPGHGNSNSPKDYSLTDKNLSGGSKFTYRLKQIDNDGKFEYSDEVEVELAPNEFALFQNYPNPFNPATNIKFALPTAGNLTISIYSILGEKIKDLVAGFFKPGVYTATFDGSDFTSGTYIYTMLAESAEGGFVQVKKMLFLK
jgi:hypothetical protein